MNRNDRQYVNEIAGIAVYLILLRIDDLERRVLMALEDLLATAAGIAEAVGEIGAKVSQVVADFTDTDSKLDQVIDQLNALVAAGGLTPEQQAAIDDANTALSDAKATLAAANEQLGTVDQAIIDAGNNPGSPVPPPEPAPEG